MPPFFYAILFTKKISFSTFPTLLGAIMAGGRKSKLTEGVIEQICQYVKLRMKVKEIAEILGIYPGTLRDWIREGEKAKSGIKRQLVDAIEKAKSELTADLTQIVVNAAFLGSETVTEKAVILPDGTTRREITTKRAPPNAAEARRILALMHPDRWAETKHIKYEWKESLENIGLDPQRIEEGFFRDLENREDTNGNPVVVPLIKKKTV